MLCRQYHYKQHRDTELGFYCFYNYAREYHWYIFVASRYKTDTSLDRLISPHGETGGLFLFKYAKSTHTFFTLHYDTSHFYGGMLGLYGLRQPSKANNNQGKRGAQMKKIVIILSDKGFHNFRFNLLKHREQVEFVLIAAHHALNSMTPSRQKGFDKIYGVDTKYPETVQGAKRRILSESQTRKVIETLIAAYPKESISLHCYDEMNLLFAATLREEFSLKGPYGDQLLPFRDKIIMKSKLQQSGIRTPVFDYFIIDEYVKNARQYFTKIVGYVGLPFIIKPVDAAGSEGVSLINSFQDFSQLCLSDDFTYEYEEYISGKIFSVNCVSEHQKILICGITEYLVATKEVQAGKLNADIFLLESDPRYIRLKEFATKALAALEYANGASHMELFLTDDDEIVFLEVGARFKGLLGLEAMEMNFGVNITNLTLSIESGVESHSSNLPQCFCFDGVLPKCAGIVKALNNPDVKSKFKIIWNVQVGDRVKVADSLLNNAGTFLMWNDNYDALYQDYLSLTEYKPIEYLD